MAPFAATNLLPTVSHCQFRLRLVTVGDNLPPTHDYNPYKYIVLKKKINFFYTYVHAQSY